MPYAVHLEPDKRLRRLQLACGVILYAAGAALLWGMPIGMLPKVGTVVAWLAIGRLEWRRQLRGFRRVAGIRIHETGALECLDSCGTRQSVSLMAGSVVLRRLAWLRLKFGDGSHYGELLSGHAQRQAEWHGLQLTWAQCGQRFGRPD